MHEIQAKGLTFVSVLSAIDDLRGREFRDQVIAAMPEESGTALRYGSVIASGWYPIRWYRELFKAALEIADKPDFAREIGRASVRREIKGVHRLLFKVLSVETLQKQGSRFFKAYFQPTDIKNERLGPGLGRTLFLRCTGFDRNLWQEQLGCCEELLAQSGVQLPRVRVLAGGTDRDDYMEMETRWR
jgi:hypothetical protein